MKKVLAMLLSVCMLLGCICAAAAEEITEINWEDYEPTVIEEDWAGDFVAVDGIAVKFWLPSVLLPVELTEDDLESGLIAFYATKNGDYSLGIAYVDVNGMTLEEYAEKLLENNDIFAFDCVINDLPAINYIDDDNDCACVAFGTDNGYILQFVLAPASDEDFLEQIIYLVASIQADE